MVRRRKIQRLITPAMVRHLVLLLGSGGPHRPPVVRPISPVLISLLLQVVSHRAHIMRVVLCLAALRRNIYTALGRLEVRHTVDKLDLLVIAHLLIGDLPAEIATDHMIAAFFIEKDRLWLLVFDFGFFVVAMVLQFQGEVGHRVEEEKLEGKHGVEKAVTHVARVISCEVNPAVEVEKDGEATAEDEGRHEDALALDELFHFLVQLVCESFADRSD